MFNILHDHGGSSPQTTFSADCLLACLSFAGGAIDAESLSVQSTEHWESLYRLAFRLGVAPLLYHRLYTKGAITAAPPAIRQALKETYVGAAARTLTCGRELQQVGSALQVAGIPIIVLKGAFLAEVVYRNPGARTMNDLDLLVPSEQLAAAAQILAGLGYPNVGLLDAAVVVATVQHMPLAGGTERGGAVEVHWNLTPPHHPYSVEIDEFWQRAIPATIAGLPLQALAPEDLLLHLCMHLAYMHEFACGLRPFCDIAATLDHYGDQLDWTAIVERAIRWRWQRGVYLALHLAEEWLGAAVPASALAALRPADFDPALLRAAYQQIFSDVTEAPARMPSLAYATLWRRGHLVRGVCTVFDRLCPSRPELTLRYGVRPDSPAIYGCYLRRWLDLFTRYSPITGRLLNRNAPMAQFVRARQALGNWIARA